MINCEVCDHNKVCKYKDRLTEDMKDECVLNVNGKLIVTKVYTCENFQNVWDIIFGDIKKGELKMEKLINEKLLSYFRKYKFLDHISNEIVYVYGTDKFDALQRCFGITRTRIILKNCKVERVYD